MKRFLISLFAFVTFTAYAATFLDTENRLWFTDDIVKNAIVEFVSEEKQQAVADLYQDLMDQETGKISIDSLFKVCRKAGFNTYKYDGFMQCRSFIQKMLEDAQIAEEVNIDGFCPGLDENGNNPNKLRSITDKTRIGDFCSSTNIQIGQVIFKPGYNCSCMATVCNEGFEFKGGACVTRVADGNGNCLREAHKKTSENDNMEKCKAFCEKRYAGKACKYTATVISHSTGECICNPNSVEVNNAYESMQRAEERKINSLRYYEVCGNDRGKTGGTEVCEKSTFNWVNVGQLQALGLAEEYARIRYNDDIACDNDHRTSGNDDYVRCRSKNSKRYYEFKFDDIKESIDADIQKGLVLGICGIHKIPSGIIKSSIGYSGAPTCKSSCTSEMLKTAARFGLTATTRGSFCWFSNRSISADEVESSLAKIDGIDNYIFYSGIQIQGSKGVITQLKDYIKSTGKTVRSFDCTRNVDEIKNSLFVGDDDILRCTLNGQPIDFVFEDFSESWLYVQEDGEAKIQCVVSGGKYADQECFGLTQQQCLEANAVFKKKFPGASGMRWNGKECVLLDSAEAQRYDIYVQAGIGVVAAADCLLLTHTGCLVLAVETVGLATELTTKEFIENRAGEFLAVSTRCNNRDCAIDTIRNAGKVLSVMGSLDAAAANSVDSELARLVDYLEPEDLPNVSSGDWNQIVAQLGGDPDDTGGTALVWLNRIGLGAQFASVATSGYRLLSKAITRLASKAARTANAASDAARAANNASDASRVDEALTLTRPQAKRLDDLRSREQALLAQKAAGPMSASEAAKLDDELLTVQQEQRTLLNQLGNPSEEALTTAKASAYNKAELDAAQTELAKLEERRLYTTNRNGEQILAPGVTRQEANAVEAQKQALRQRIAELGGDTPTSATSTAVETSARSGSQSVETAESATTTTRNTENVSSGSSTSVFDASRALDNSASLLSGAKQKLALGGSSFDEIYEGVLRGGSYPASWSESLLTSDELAVLNAELAKTGKKLISDGKGYFRFADLADSASDAGRATNTASDAGRGAGSASDAGRGVGTGGTANATDASRVTATTSDAVRTTSYTLDELAAADANTILRNVENLSESDIRALTTKLTPAKRAEIAQLKMGMKPGNMTVQQFADSDDLLFIRGEFSTFDPELSRLRRAAEANKDAMADLQKYAANAVDVELLKSNAAFYQENLLRILASDESLLNSYRNFDNLSSTQKQRFLFNLLNKHGSDLGIADNVDIKFVSSFPDNPTGVALYRPINGKPTIQISESMIKQANGKTSMDMLMEAATHEFGHFVDDVSTKGVIGSQLTDAGRFFPKKADDIQGYLLYRNSPKEQSSFVIGSTVGNRFSDMLQQTLDTGKVPTTTFSKIDDFKIQHALAGHEVTLVDNVNDSYFFMKAKPENISGLSDYFKQRGLRVETTADGVKIFENINPITDATRATTNAATDGARTANTVTDVARATDTATDAGRVASTNTFRVSLETIGYREAGWVHKVINGDSRFIVKRMSYPDEAEEVRRVLEANPSGSNLAYLGVDGDDIVLTYKSDVMETRPIFERYLSNELTPTVSVVSIGVDNNTQNLSQKQVLNRAVDTNNRIYGTSYYDDSWGDTLEMYKSSGLSRLAENHDVLSEPITTIRGYNVFLEDIPGANGKIGQISGRPIVVVNVNGKKIPFYISTGSAGNGVNKLTVPSGKWEAIFGIEKRTDGAGNFVGSGWFNKGSLSQIENHYGSRELKQIADALDDKIGDVRDTKLVNTSATRAANGGIGDTAISTLLPNIENSAALDLINESMINGAQAYNGSTTNFFANVMDIQNFLSNL